MNNDATIEPGMDEDDALAAEFVLGVLEQPERSRLALRVEHDATFARLVADWEERLSGLDDGFDLVTPPASVKAALDQRLFAPTEQAAPQSAQQASTSLWQSLTFWRVLSAGAVLGLAALIFVSLRAPDQHLAGQTLVASLAAENGPAQFVALYETSTQTLRVSTVGGKKPNDKDFELWIIAGDNPPKSLGLVGGIGDKALRVEVGLQAAFVEGVTLAVSLEPTGGSATELPTGPVIAVGTVKKI